MNPGFVAIGIGMLTLDICDSEFARCVAVWCVSETIEPTSDLNHEEWLVAERPA